MDPRKVFWKSWIWILDSQHYCLEIFKSERLPDLRFSSLDLACQSGSQHAPINLEVNMSVWWVCPTHSARFRHSILSGSQSQAPDSLQSLLDRVMAGEVQTACGSKAFGCDGLQYWEGVEVSPVGLLGVWTPEATRKMLRTLTLPKLVRAQPKKAQVALPAPVTW